MSIEILASKLPDVMGTYRHLSHTFLSCIGLVSCVYTSEQDVPKSTFGCSDPSSFVEPQTSTVSACSVSTATLESASVELSSLSLMLVTVTYRYRLPLIE